jgi:hypothetical protein
MQMKFYDQETRMLNGRMSTPRMVAYILTIVEDPDDEAKSRTLDLWLPERCKFGAGDREDWSGDGEASTDWIPADWEQGDEHAAERRVVATHFQAEE